MSREKREKRGQDKVSLAQKKDTGERKTAAQELKAPTVTEIAVPGKVAIKKWMKFVQILLRKNLCCVWIEMGCAVGRVNHVKEKGRQGETEEESE